MSNVGNRWEYVKMFEVPDALPPETYIVVRLDGRGFRRFTDEHSFTKPVDERGLLLMNAAAAAVMRDWGDVILAFGHSDEYSFVFPPRAVVFGRRAAKLATGIATLFAGEYVRLWGSIMGDATPLRRAPAFDARAVAYPRLRHVADYFRWRAADAHVNALYNAAFWALVQHKHLPPGEAHAALMGSSSETKHEILHGMGINYAKLPAISRRGTSLARGSLGGQAEAPSLSDADVAALRLPRSVTLHYADLAGEPALLNDFFAPYEV